MRRPPRSPVNLESPSCTRPRLRSISPSHSSSPSIPTPSPSYTHDVEPLEAEPSSESPWLSTLEQDLFGDGVIATGGEPTPNEDPVPTPQPIETPEPQEAPAPSQPGRKTRSPRPSRSRRRHPPRCHRPRERRRRNRPARRPPVPPATANRSTPTAKFSVASVDRRVVFTSPVLYGVEGRLLLTAGLR